MTARRVRTCIGCRVADPPEHLLRLALDDGRVVPNSAGTLPGRGAWLHPTPACLAAAERRRAWSRAFRASGPFDVSAVRSQVEARV